MRKIVNRNVGIATAVGIAVIIGAITFQLYESSYQRTTSDEFLSDKNQNESGIKHVVYQENPQKLRGLMIMKDKYLLGENVFLRVNDIPMGLKDNLQFFTPKGILYLSIPFDGNEKSSFKHYFRPQLMKSLGICERDDLIGKWTALFQGLPNEKLHFEVMSEVLPHSDEYYITCEQTPIEFPRIQPSLGE